MRRCSINFRNVHSLPKLGDGSMDGGLRPSRDDSPISRQHMASRRGPASFRSLDHVSLKPRCSSPSAVPGPPLPCSPHEGSSSQRFRPTKGIKCREGLLSLLFPFLLLPASATCKAGLPFPTCRRNQGADNHHGTYSSPPSLSRLGRKGQTSRHGISPMAPRTHVPYA